MNKLLKEGQFTAFADALRFTLAVKDMGKAAGMAALGVARRDDRELTAEGGADLVVTTLDDVSLPALAEGCLKERRADAEPGRRRPGRDHLSPGTHPDFSLERRP